MRRRQRTHLQCTVRPGPVSAGRLRDITFASRLVPLLEAVGVAFAAYALAAELFGAAGRRPGRTTLARVTARARDRPPRRHRRAVRPRRHAEFVGSRTLAPAPYHPRARMDRCGTGADRRYVDLRRAGRAGQPRGHPRGELAVRCPTRARPHGSGRCRDLDRLVDPVRDPGSSRPQPSDGHRSEAVSGRGFLSRVLQRERDPRLSARRRLHRGPLVVLAA